jgi:hypothetical protein
MSSGRAAPLRRPPVVERAARPALVADHGRAAVDQVDAPPAQVGGEEGDVAAAGDEVFDVRRAWLRSSIRHARPRPAGGRRSGITRIGMDVEVGAEIGRIALRTSQRMKRASQCAKDWRGEAGVVVVGAPQTGPPMPPPGRRSETRAPGGWLERGGLW